MNMETSFEGVGMQFSYTTSFYFGELRFKKTAFRWIFVIEEKQDFTVVKQTFDMKSSEVQHPFFRRVTEAIEYSFAFANFSKFYCH